MSDIDYECPERKTVWESQYLKVELVDTTTVMEITDNYYNRSRLFSLTEMIELRQQLAQAIDVTIKELKKLNHDVTYSEQMQEQLEPIEEPLDSKSKLYNKTGVASSGRNVYDDSGYPNHLPRLIKEIEDRATLRNDKGIKND